MGLVAVRRGSVGVRRGPSVSQQSVLLSRRLRPILRAMQQPCLHVGPSSQSAFRQALLILAACLCLPTATTLAQPAFSESFFIAPGEGDGESAQAVETCAQTFRQPVLQSGAFIERQTPEVAQVVSECVGSTASSSFARECDLATAQSQVDVIILLQATETPRGWLFQGTAMSPLQAGAVWADSVLVEEQHALLAGLDACARLGHSFLVGRGVEAGAAPQNSAAVPTTGANQAPTRGRLEIIDITPVPVTVLVNGAEAGLAPGQFLDLPLGTVEVVLQATGYQDLARSVELTAEGMATLRGLALDPLEEYRGLVTCQEGRDRDWALPAWPPIARDVSAAEAQQLRQQMSELQSAQIVQWQQVLRRSPSHARRSDMLFRLATAQMGLADAEDSDLIHGLERCCVSSDTCRLGDRADYSEAMGTLVDLVGQYPNYERLDEALFQLGVAQLRSGELDAARESLRRLQSSYPSSQHLGDAVSLLEELSE